MTGFFRRHSLADERGTIMILFAVLLVVLIGMTALMTDMLFWLRVRQELQAVADGAALAGAMELDESDFAMQQEFRLDAGRAVDSASTYCQDYPLITCAILVERGPVGTVTVEAQQDVQGFFARALSPAFGSILIRASATAATLGGY